MSDLDISPRQAAILDRIRSAVASGLPIPTQRELAMAVGLQSFSTVNYHLQALARKGIVTWTRGRNRSLVLVEKARHCPHCGQQWDSPERRAERASSPSPLSGAETAVLVAVCRNQRAGRVATRSLLAYQTGQTVAEVSKAVGALQALGVLGFATPSVRGRGQTEPGPTSPPSARPHDS